MIMTAIDPNYAGEIEEGGEEEEVEAEQSLLLGCVGLLAPAPAPDPKVLFPATRSRFAV